MRIMLLVLVVLWGLSSLWAGLAAVLAPGAPQTALALNPAQPRALAQLLVQDAGEEAGWGRLGDAQTLLRAAPISDLALTYAGAAALSEARLADAERLLEAAIARNPRREASLALSASAAMAQNRTETALARLSRLVVLDPPRAGAYLDAIAALAETEEGREWMASEALAADAAAPAILAHLTRVHSDLPLLLEINRTDRAAQAILVDRALQERGATVAFIMWLSLLPQDLQGDFSWPFNPRFEDIVAPPPFNWTYTAQGISRSTETGLLVSYNGRGRQSFLTQLMLLRPGLYRFSSTVSGDGQERGAGIVWEISCADTGVMLGRTQRAGFRGAPTRVEAVIEVPATGCEGQRLTLIGAPGEFPMRTRATIGAASLEAVDP